MSGQVSFPFFALNYDVIVTVILCYSARLSELRWRHQNAEHVSKGDDNK